MKTYVWVVLLWNNNTHETEELIQDLITAYIILIMQIDMFLFCKPLGVIIVPMPLQDVFCWSVKSLGVSQSKVKSSDMTKRVKVWELGKM